MPKNDLPLYKREFKEDFDLGFDLAKFPQLNDCSWHNDISPHFEWEHAGEWYALWIAHQDKSKRDVDARDVARYAVFCYGELDDPEDMMNVEQSDVVTMFVSDVPEELVSFLESHVDPAPSKFCVCAHFDDEKPLPYILTADTKEAADALAREKLTALAGGKAVHITEVIKVHESSLETSFISLD